MSAFGKRGGMSGGSRPSFGVAKPMKSGPGASVPAEGGEQFPPVEDLAEAMQPEVPLVPGGAMDRQNSRQNASGEAASSEAAGFEASVHRITAVVRCSQADEIGPWRFSPGRGW